MKRIAVAFSASTFVRTTPDLLFALLNDVERFFDLRPDAIEHRDIETLPTGGHACTQVYELRGRHVTLRCRTTEFDPPWYFADDVEAADHRARVTTTLTPADSGTQLSIQHEVTLSKPTGAIRRRAIRLVAERSLRESMSRIRSVAEAATS